MGVVHHRRSCGGCNIAASDLAKMHRFVTDPRQGAARQADPGLRLRLQAADFLQRLLPHLHQAARAPAGRRYRPHRIRRDRRRRRHQDRHRHPGTGHRFRPVGGQLPRHRGHRPRRPQPRKVVARHQVPGLPGRVDAVLPELPEPGQPLRLPRAELLQHDGIPDAAHGPAVREVKRRGATTFEVTEDANAPLPGPDDRTARRLAVHHRQLRDGAVLLLQPQRRADAAAADDDAGRDQRSVDRSR